MTPALEAMARALAASFARDGEPEKRDAYVEKFWPKWVDDAKAALNALPEQYAEMVGEIVGEGT